MADPKGVYYGPSETGWATVLPEGPNLAGLVAMKQRQEALTAKREADVAAKKMAEKQRSEKEALDALVSPAKTDAFYQPELDAKVKEAISTMQKMIMKEKSPVEIRSYAATAAQDITSFAASGTQVWSDIQNMMTWNKQHGNIINEDALKKYLVSNVLLKDNQKRNPAEIYQVENGFRNAEDYVYENPNGAAAGAALLDEGAVMKQLLKSDAFKNAVTEYSNITSKVQAEYVNINQTGGRTSIRPFAEVLPNGEVSVLDANQLEESGLLGPMLDYKPFAQLIQGDLEMIKKLDPGKTYTIEEENLMRAEAARQRLQGYAAGGAATKKIDHNTVRMRALGGGGGAGKMKGQEYWEMAIRLGNPSSLREALSYLNAGISFLPPDETRNGLAQSKLIPYEMNPKASRYEFRPAPNLYGAVQYVEYDRKGNIIPNSVINIRREAFAESEAIKSIYAQSVKKMQRAFGTGAAGGIQSEAELKAQYDKRVEDVGSPGAEQGIGAPTIGPSQAGTGGPEEQLRGSLTPRAANAPGEMKASAEEYGAKGPTGKAAGKKAPEKKPTKAKTTKVDYSKK